MPITGTPTDITDNTVVVTPTGSFTVNGEGGTDTLELNYAALASSIDYRYAGGGWYSFTDDFLSSTTFINFERFILRGGSGDDVLTGGGDVDQLYGGAGADVLNSGLGADTIDGGGGLYDRWVAGYGSLVTAVAVSLQASGSSTVAATGVTVSNIEQLDITTGIGADAIDTLAVTGSDNVSTGEGDDVFRTAGGIDVFNGGGGSDRMVVDYSDATTRVVQNYVGGGWYKIFDQASTRSVNYINVESFDLVGGSGSDSLAGGDLADRLVGNAGNDWLNGGAGTDTISGGSGTDTWQVKYSELTDDVFVDLVSQTSSTGAAIGGIEAIHFTGTEVADTVTALPDAYNDTFATAGGEDVITTGRGRDWLDAGAGTDRLVMDWSAIADPLNAISNYYAGGGWYRFIANDDVNRLDYINVEQFDLSGGAGADTLGGGGLYDWLRGNDGNDSLDTAAGDALVDGGAGNDRWSANLTAETQALVIDLRASQAASQGTLAGFDIRNIEMLSLTAGTGNDVISAPGYSFNDSISLIDGDDRVNPGLGRDTIDGGAGTDVLVMDWSRINSTLNGVLSTYQGGGWYRFATADGANFVDYINIEKFDLTGSAGADSLTGAASYDWLRGGDGNDTLNSAAGDALIAGGNGNDRWTADLSAEPKAVIFKAAASQSTAQATGSGSNVRTIEALSITTGAGADVLSTAGYALDDVVSSGAGNDSIASGLGRDTVDGGAGVDLLTLNYATRTSGIGQSYIGGGWYRYTDLDNSTHVDYINIERFDVTGGTGNDYLIGGALTDVLRGGNGNDTLDGASGRDSIYGGAGTDTWIASHGDALIPLVLTLDASGNGNLNGIGTALSQIENVSLTTGLNNDTINLAASLGNDSIVTGDGDDSINVGAGRLENVNGGVGTDTLAFDAGLAASGIRMTYTGGGWYRYASSTGDYQLDFINIDKLKVVGTGKGDRLTGFGGSDTLSGGAGADILDGAAGNDTLTGGLGNDQFYFGDVLSSGVDTVTDAAAGDFLRLANLTLSGSMGSGTGGSLLAGAAEVSSADGFTTIFVGVDGTPGADFQARLAGTFGAGNFSISGHDIFIT